MNPLVPFNQTIVDAEKGIEGAVAEEHAIQRQLSRGCGLLEGYYRAGGTSKFEYEAGCIYLRRVAEARVGMLDLQRQAREAGMA